MLKKRFKENWLIVIAATSLCTAIGLFFLFKEESLYPRGKDYSNYSFVLISFFIIIFAPVVEELSFRGFYTSKRVFFLISLFLLPVFVLFTNPQYWFILILFYLALFFYFRFKIAWIWKLTIILNVILFALMHYEINDFTNFKSITFPFQFAFGFLSIWIVINFNLFKAIVAHFTWNTVLMLILFFGIQFPDETVNTYNDDLFHASWSRVPHFNSKPGKFSIKENRVLMENLTAKKLSDFLNYNSSSPETYQSEPFMKYNLTLQVKDSVSKQNLQILTKKFLEDQNLLIYKEK